MDRVFLLHLAPKLHYSRLAMPEDSLGVAYFDVKLAQLGYRIDDIMLIRLKGNQKD